MLLNFGFLIFLKKENFQPAKYCLFLTAKVKYFPDSKKSAQFAGHF